MDSRQEPPWSHPAYFTSTNLSRDFQASREDDYCLWEGYAEEREAKLKSCTLPSNARSQQDPSQEALLPPESAPTRVCSHQSLAPSISDLQ